MDLDSGLYYDYQKLLDTFGQFRGFKELLKIDELFTRLKEFNLFGAKSIVVKLDVPSNISLLGIDDLLSNINKYIAKDTQLAYYANVNDELKKDEIICHILIVEDKK